MDVSRGHRERHYLRGSGRRTSSAVAAYDAAATSRDAGYKSRRVGMSVTELEAGQQGAPDSRIDPERPPVINDFSIRVATKNGSGSQTANTTLLRALFKMGIPVTGKNIFPSNIQGLPTWYTIRLSKDGYIARRETAEIVVAMNRNTAAEDIAGVPPGGVVIYPSEWK